MPGAAGYDPGLQRHHLLPIQLLGERYFQRMFAVIGRGRIGFDDFRANGILLPPTRRHRSPSDCRSIAVRTAAIARS